MAAQPTHRRAALAAATGSALAPVVVLGAWVVPAAGGGLLESVLVIAALAAMAGTLVVGVPVGVVADRVLLRLRPSLPSGRFHDVATDVTIGLGEPATLLVHADETADVLGLPATDREVVVVTTAAFDVLTRREIVALAAARLAAMRDPWCRLATNAALVWWGLRFALPVIAVAALLTGSAAAAIVALGVLATVLVVPRWPERVRDRCADAVAIRTAHDPGGLAGAARRLSGLGRRRDDLPASDLRRPRPTRAVPRLAGGAMTTDVGSGHRRRRYVLACIATLEAADQAVGMREPVGLGVVSGQDLRRRWAHLGRPVDVD